MLTEERTEYLTVDQAAVRAGVSSITVRRAIKDGKLHYRAQRGQTKLLRASEVDDWARQRTELREISEED